MNSLKISTLDLAEGNFFFFFFDRAECGVKSLSTGELLAVMVRSALDLPLSSARVEQTKRGRVLIWRPVAGIWLLGLLI